MYPFVNPQTKGTYQKDLYSIAQANHKVRTGFCSRFSSYLADDFDAITKDYCQLRSQQLSSADAFRQASTNDFLFVEFKDMSEEFMNGVGRGTPPIDPVTGKETHEETMEVSLRKKAFDSISVACGTVCNAIPQLNVSRNAMFIVVRQDEPSAFTELANSLRQLACIDKEPLWELAELVDKKLYREVYTLTESEFDALLPSIW